MEDFVNECNALFSALNNALVEMPSGYSGNVPVLRIESGALVLDMKDANVFSTSKINWVLEDKSTSPRVVNFDTYSASVTNGYLTIRVGATAT